MGHNSFCKAKGTAFILDRIRLMCCTKCCHYNPILYILYRFLYSIVICQPVSFLTKKNTSFCFGQGSNFVLYVSLVHSSSYYRIKQNKHVDSNMLKKMNYLNVSGKWYRCHRGLNTTVSLPECHPTELCHLLNSLPTHTDTFKSHTPCTYCILPHSQLP